MTLRPLCRLGLLLLALFPQGVDGLAAQGRAQIEAALRKDLRAIGSKVFSVPGKPPHVGSYRLRSEVLRWLNQYDWFGLWYECSPQFRSRIDRYLAGGARVPMVESQFLGNGWMTVTADVPEACVYLNGVFADRVPLTDLLVPADTYDLVVRSRGKAFRTKVTLTDKESVAVAVHASDLTAGVGLGPSQDRIAWKRRLKGSVFTSRVRGLVATPGGVIALKQESEGLRFSLYEKESGSLEWETVFPREITTPIVSVADGVAFGAADGLLYKLQQTDGKVVAVVRLGGVPRLAPLRSDSVVFCLAEKEQTTTTWAKAVDAAANRELWSYTAPGVPIAGLLLEGRYVFLRKDPSRSSWRLTCLDAGSGRELWSRRIDEPENLLIDGDGRELFLGVAGAVGGGGVFVNPDTGDKVDGIEAVPGIGVVSASVRDGLGLFLTTDGLLHLFDLKARRRMWSHESPFQASQKVTVASLTRDHVVLSAPLRDSPGASLGLSTGAVAVLAAPSGDLVSFRECLLQEPVGVMGRNRIFVPDSAGQSTVIDLERGHSIWGLETLREGEDVDTLDTAVQGSRIYLHSRNRGTLFAIDLP